MYRFIEQLPGSSSLFLGGWWRQFFSVESGKLGWCLHCAYWYVQNTAHFIIQCSCIKCVYVHYNHRHEVNLIKMALLQNIWIKELYIFLWYGFIIPSLTLNITMAMTLALSFLQFLRKCKSTICIFLFQVV